MTDGKARIQDYRKEGEPDWKAVNRAFDDGKDVVVIDKPIELPDNAWIGPSKGGTVIKRREKSYENG